jgi:hypothetical protein
VGGVVDRTLSALQHASVQLLRLKDAAGVRLVDVILVSLRVGIGAKLPVIELYEQEAGP